MIVTEDEQGYAPAAHLEAIDKTYDSAEPECSNDEGQLWIYDTFGMTTPLFSINQLINAMYDKQIHI